MAFLVSSLPKLRKTGLRTGKALYSSDPCGMMTLSDDERILCGNREFVGFGVNGRPWYFDRPSHPFSAIRFRPTTPEIMALREKERGDWRKLSIAEKKTLYRASFCQTFAEMNGLWSQNMATLRYGFGWALIWISAMFWFFLIRNMMNAVPVGEFAHPTLMHDNRIETYNKLVDMNYNPLQKMWRPTGAAPREFKYNPMNPNYKPDEDEEVVEEADPC